INEKDNELPQGENHWVVIGDSEHASPVIKFGQPPKNILPKEPRTFLPTNHEYTFKVDVSSVLKQFEEQGYYEACDGTKIAQDEFKGFYLAGSAEPLTWDYVNLANKGLKLEPTSHPEVYSLTIVFNPFDEADHEDKEWKLTKDIGKRPRYTSDQPIVDALFNLSLEEAIKNIEPDRTLRTGAKWGGVWTRDVSYSILLAFAFHEPEVAKISLRRKVKRGRIVQDPGSGGAWPVSSDRTTWVLAAWEIYKVTGDGSWLDEIYPIIKNTLDDDYKTVYDEEFGMYSGESSFLDWREQTYPKWMDNRDIYVSQNLGTNVVHYQAHRIFTEIAKIKGQDYAEYESRAEVIKKGINDYLWLNKDGYYGQYLYGRNDLLVSSRFEALGEALAVLFEVADKEQAVAIVAKSPLTEFGVTCIFPQISDIPSYHNNSIWPFVQAYWNWAAAKTGNEAVLNHGLASLYRAATLFLTNYENMVADTGDFLGTEVNSHRMLWSIAGNLAMVYRIFMGMVFKPDGLYLNPVVPKAYAGHKNLTNFKYGKAVLNITVEGYGNEISSVVKDGKIEETAFIPKGKTGTHDIVIQLANNEFPHQDINLTENHFTLPTVLADKDGTLLTWQAVQEAKEYRIYKNGVFLQATSALKYRTKKEKYASYMVSAIDHLGYEGFASQPVVFANNEQVIELESVAPISDKPYTNYSGTGFVEISLNTNREINIPIKVDEPGTFLLDFRFSNGTGPLNTDNNCAIRSLSVNGDYQGVIVLPQRGWDEWSDWGYSNSHEVQLKAGKNMVKIHFEEWNNNMDGNTNMAMLDCLRIIQSE
ncbi:MAG: glycogen debranching protein, partial [Pricia sp.]|nr:glycogen debranching protein [Pricia sp.]